MASTIPDRTRARGIGVIGTAARVLIGLALVGSVVRGDVAWGFRLGPWALGLIGFPALLLVGQWLRSRRNPARFQATGAIATTLNMLVVAAHVAGLMFTSTATRRSITARVPRSSRGR